MSLNLNWYKSYDTKQNNSENANLCFWTKLQKSGNGNISVLCYNFWSNQNLEQFRPVKHVKMTVWTSVLWKMNIPIAKKWPDMVVTSSFIKEHSFRISLYILMDDESLGCQRSIGLTWRWRKLKKKIACWYAFSAYRAYSLSSWLFWIRLDQNRSNLNKLDFSLPDGPKFATKDLPLG